ncbi:MAG: two-component regulator propeller domain-containing protein [Saprospiraceae bacterium]
MPNNEVSTLTEGKDDNIWFGGSDGLWRYDGEIVKDMTTE